MVALSPTRRLVGAVVHRATVLFFIVFAVFPFYWMVVTAFKQNADLYVGATDTTHNPFIFNRAPTLDHLRTLFGQTLYLTWLTNTLLVGLVVVLITLALAVPAGYSLARLTGRWGERLSIGIFLTYLIPSTLLFIPFSRLVSLLGLTNSHWALILIYPTFTVPFCTWLLIGFFKALPTELEEAALVDGATRPQALVRVLLPLAAPGIVASAIFAFTLSWNEFLYALIFIQDETAITVPVGLNLLIYGDVFHWGQLMAASVITTVPVVALYMFIHRWMVEGLAAGAVKG